MAVTNFLWNDISDTVVMEKDGAGATTAVYQSDPVPFGRLRSMRRGGTTYNYHYDGRGNTTYLTEQTGQKTDTYTNDAFGVQRTATGSTENPYRYGGQYGYQHSNQSDTYYVRSRVYSPRRCRWLSKDPLRFVDVGTPWSYARNCPLGIVDPSGLKIKKTTLTCPHDVGDECSCDNSSCVFELYFSSSILCLSHSRGQATDQTKAVETDCQSDINRSIGKNDFLELVLRDGTKCRFTSQLFPKDNSWPPKWDDMPLGCKDKISPRLSTRLPVSRDRQGGGCYLFRRPFKTVEVNITVEIQ